MAEETQKINHEQAKAIMRVAYLLAAVDGEICESEHVQFRMLLKRLFGEKLETPDVVGYLEGVAEEGRKLIAVRAFYDTDEQIIKVFSGKVAESVSAIVSDAYVLRCAFAIWISICCADRNFMDIERKAIQRLQEIVNPNALSKLLGAGTAFGTAASAAAVLLAPVALAIPAAAVAGIMSHSSNGKSITPAFLKEVEKRVVKIGDFYRRAAEAKDGSSKQNYLGMYEFEVEDLREFLQD